MQTLAEIIQTAKNPEYEITLSELELAERHIERMNAEEGELNLADEYDCPICHNKGKVFFIKTEVDESGKAYHREVSEDCKCMKTRKSIRRMKKSGLENTISKCTFEAYETSEEWQEQIKNRAMEFASDNTSNWFFIGGAVGCGKTHLCTAIARELLLSGKEVIYMLWVDESLKLKALVNDEKYSERIDQLKKAEVLYIDDFFKALKNANGEIVNPTPADVKLAYEILNYRYQNPNLITIISSERYLSEIEEIDSAVGSRIYEIARKYVLNISRDRKRNYRLKGNVLI